MHHPPKRTVSSTDPAALHHALGALAEGVVITDAAGRVVYVNPAAEALAGCRAEEARGRPLDHVLVLVHEQTRERLPDPVQGCRRGGGHLELPADTLLVARAGKKESAVEVVTTRVPADQEAACRYAVILRDVTELRGLTRLMRFQATHDPLTGLLNRREFESRLRRSLGAAARAQRRHAVCYLDLDQFGIVNHTGGYAAGDRLLREVAEHLVPRVRSSDSLARIESDRFALLLEDCPLRKAREVAEGLREAVRALRFAWEDRVFELSASIGVVPVDPGADNFADVMSAAAAACERAKARGRNRVEVCEAEGALEQHRNLVRWMRRVQHAVEHGRFQLLAQSIRPLTGGEQRPHVELLVRMVDESGGLVSPQTFLAAAETYSLMPAIDRCVVEKALTVLARGTPELERFSLWALNLSGQSLSEQDFLAFVTGLLQRTGVPASRLCFEITETAVIADLERARRFIDALQVMGCRFALDDFGSGQSSFGYLRQLHADFLKIDGSFVRRMAEDPTDRAMVESINQIGHALGMRTVAEFVQSPRTLAMLREMGVDFAQGSAIEEPWPVG